MWGESLRDALNAYDKDIITEENGVIKPILKDHISVKEAVFPFNKLGGADLILGPEMKSTGEVMGISSNFGSAFAKAQDAAKNFLPKDGGKVFAPRIAQGLVQEGFEIVATSGSYNTIRDSGIDCTKVLKVSEGRPNITDSLMNEEIVMAINTSDGKESSKEDGMDIRRMVLRMNVPYFTTVSGALASVEAIKSMKNKEMNPKSIQDFLGIN
jgi:carbamoyl-phosphate synthase large subunit